MKWHPHLTMLGVLTFVVLGAAAGQLQAQTPSREELTALAAKREALFESFEVHAKGKGGPSGKPGNVGQYRLIIHHENLRYTAQWGDVQTDFAIQDGISTKVSGDEKGWHTALISRDTTGVPYGVPIHEFVTKAYNRPLSEFIEKVATNIFREGEDVVVEAVRLKDDEVSDYRVRAFLRPSLNFALVRVSRHLRRKGTESWRRQLEVQMNDFAEYGDTGNYVPRLATYEIFTLPEGAMESIRFLGFSFQFSNWRFPAEARKDRGLLPKT